MKIKLLKIIESWWTIDHDLKELSGFKPRIHADYALEQSTVSSKGIRYTNNALVNIVLRILLRVLVSASRFFGIGIGLLWRKSNTMYLVVINKRRSAWRKYGTRKNITT